MRLFSICREGVDALIRNVARWKAAVAGAAGAAAMQAAAYAFEAAHIPVIDFASEIGSIVYPNGGFMALSAGLLAHAAVGIAWAMFYAYFFWGRLRLARPLQGLVFAAIPAVLAIAIVHPQLQLMQLHSEVVKVGLTDFLDVAPLAVLTVLAIHAVYGLTMGAVYTHPVGYRVGRQPKYPHPRREIERTAERGRTNDNGFIFATGVECSYPTIDHGRWRRDELQSTRHYQNWQRDFEQCRQVGITHLRYGPPLHLTFPGPGKYNWGWIDEPMAELEAHGPEPIVDLFHFGVPDWLETVQNPELAPAMAEYAAAFAERYPWVRFYTPVNEMYVCSRMSALDGNWNEQEQDEGAFARAAVNLAATSRAICGAIVKARPDAILINSESSDFTQPCCPDPEIVRLADFENERRFLPLDLIFGHELSGVMKTHLRDHGIGDEELASFKGIDVPRRSVLGIDYYEWNERMIDSDGELRSLGELFGWYVIANQYYDRYRLPMMHTETNRMDGDAPRWLWRQWHNVQMLRRSGVPLIGFTWYSLTDQIDWNIALSKSLGLVFPVGLFDLNRDIRDVGLAYKQLIGMFADAPDFRECEHVAELMR
jgi:beta-glucosidase/6-phospho-beta-glucosidase/beta-galactosidase